MRAGLLRHRISIEQVTETQDPSGALVKTWVKVANIASTYEPQSGTEGVKEDHIQASQMVKFRIRYRNDITPKMRIVFDGKVFDITAPPLDYLGLRTETHLMGKERV